MAVQVTLIPIAQIDPNPWQTRQEEDPEHIQMLAASIAETGLRDEPMARYISETRRYQLAYGHSRLAAFRLLDGGGQYNGQYDAMPLKLAEISDLQMFELAVRENAERKDLNPIEEAKAMKRYRDEFGKTSGQVGALFGLAESTVRNKMRLVDLPESVQAQVAQRELPEVAARNLLTVQRLAPAVVESLAEKLAGDEYETPEAINRQIRYTLQGVTIEMHRPGWGGEPKGGTGLWPLGWKPGTLMTITPAQFEKVFPKYAKSQTMNTSLKQVWLALEAGEIDWDLVAQSYSLEKEFVEKAVQLIRPPACTACGFYARMDGVHYCGLKACWESKQRLWIETQLAQKSEKMNIPIYDKAEDGPDCDEPSEWNDNSQWETWIQEGADHLRLRTNYHEYRQHKLTQSHCVQLVSVRSEIRVQAERERQKQAEAKARGETPEQVRQLGRERRELVDAFLWETAANVFGQVFDGLTAAALEATLTAVHSWWQNDGHEIPEEPVARWMFLSRLLAYKVLHDGTDYEMRSRGAVHVAGLLVETARAWEVELPAGWLAMAAAFEPETVSAETGSAEVEDAE